MVGASCNPWYYTESAKGTGEGKHNPYRRNHTPIYSLTYAFWSLDGLLLVQTKRFTIKMNYIYDRGRSYSGRVTSRTLRELLSSFTVLKDKILWFFGGVELPLQTENTLRCWATALNMCIPLKIRVFPCFSLWQVGHISRIPMPSSREILFSRVTRLAIGEVRRRSQKHRILSFLYLSKLIKTQFPVLILPSKKRRITSQVDTSLY